VQGMLTKSNTSLYLTLHSFINKVAVQAHPKSLLSSARIG